MERQGLNPAILDLHRRGKAIAGICGGYQMLGKKIYDPEGIESSQRETDGLGLLPITTVSPVTRRRIASPPP